jgi:hypothetical protein
MMSSKEKGNRISNPKRKEMRVSCWVNGERRKKARQKANDQRHRANVERAADGSIRPTPHETAKALRAARREPLAAAFKLFPKDRSLADWEASRARRDALLEGERIRQAQKA